MKYLLLALLIFLSGCATVGDFAKGFSQGFSSSAQETVLCNWQSVGNNSYVTCQ